MSTAIARPEREHGRLKMDCGSGKAHIPCLEVGRRSKMRTRPLTLVVAGGLIALFALIVSHTASGEPFATSYDDEFNSAQLNTKWSWIREDASHWNLTSAPGSLRIVTQEGDLYQEYDNLKNLLLQPMPDDDFEVMTKVNLDLLADYNQGGIVLYQDRDNYLKLVRQHDSHWGGAELLFALEAAGNFDHSYHQSVPAGTQHLKISRNGTLYKGFYSSDGTNWTPAGEYSPVNFTNPMFGLLASNGYIAGAPEVAADFDFFRVKVEPIPDEWKVRSYNTDDAGGVFLNGWMVAGSMYSYYPDSGLIPVNKYWNTRGDNFVSFASWDVGVCCGSWWGFELKKNGTTLWNTEGGGPTGKQIAYAHVLKISEDGALRNFVQSPPDEQLPGRWSVRVHASSGLAFALVDKTPVAGSTWNSEHTVDVTSLLGKKNNFLHFNAWNDGGGTHEWSFAIEKDGVVVWQDQGTVSDGKRGRSAYRQITINREGKVLQAVTLRVPFDLEPHESGLGCIWSYFDHEYPIYEGQPDAASSSIVKFTGERQTESAKCNEDGSCYSGHDGIDFSRCTTDGEAVNAAADGITTGGYNSCYGYYVEIDHGLYKSVYKHLRSDSYWLESKRGKWVDAGDRIGTVGNSGSSSCTTGAHLHFGVYYDSNGDGVFQGTDDVVDPYGWLNDCTQAVSDPWTVRFRDRYDQWHTGALSKWLWQDSPPQCTTISPGSRHTLDAPAGVTIELPAGAVTQVTKLSYSLVPEPKIGKVTGVASGVSSGTITQNDVFKIAAAHENGDLMDVFAQPVTLTVAFSTRVTQNVVEETLRICRWNSDLSIWEILPTTLDPVAQVATATITTPGVFSLRGVATHNAPMISGILPSLVHNGASQDIAITGSGFWGKPTVNLDIGGLNVRLESATRLTATVPAGMAAGTYDLTLRNPDGQETVLHDAITILNALYLPMISR